MHIPAATYRIQFSPAFGFEAAARIISYLADLGISDLYASPVFKAKKGSTHGYDVVDPTRLNPELGDIESFEKLLEGLKRRGMAWLQDIVPNHMAYGGENTMLMDVLENGKNSPYYDFFDIQWEYPYEGMNGRILTPFLGTFYGEALETGEIRLAFGEEGFGITYYTLTLPLKLESYPTVLSYRLDTLKERLGNRHPDLVTFLDMVHILEALSSKETLDERHERIRHAKKMLWKLYTGNREIHRFIDETLEIYNGAKGQPESFNRLDKLLSEQLFRLSFWKVAAEEVNYRRFFNINELISLKIENERVFEFTHSLIFRLLAEGKIAGLRIDHIDGLYDPLTYLTRLKQRAAGVYLIVEKILGYKETLPSSWPVQGTTGYDFLNQVNGLFCERRNLRRCNRIFSRFTGFKIPYEEFLCDKKRMIIGKLMAGDIDNLAHLMKSIAGRAREGSDITLYGLKRALVELMASFPVYRTYLCQQEPSETDALFIRESARRAIQRNPGLLLEVTFIEKFLLRSIDQGLHDGDKGDSGHFAKRFQQYTGPLMAKGLEDTVFYIYNRLIALNEVGGSPEAFGITLSEFHEFNRKRMQHWPHSLNATATHDTKRGEDVRARIQVLSEIPREWEAALKLWSKINKPVKKTVNGASVPDRNDEYFLYQTLIGAYPFPGHEDSTFVERIKRYILKAIREAKVHTAWLKPDTEYENAYLSFIDDILTPAEQNQFLPLFFPFQKKIAFYGVFNSLSQILIKITSPGVPDFYQGTELWDLNLVDPDNRRPVDFAQRISMLDDIKSRADTALCTSISQLLEQRESGQIKLFLIYWALRARNRNRPLFEEGRYVPLRTGGRWRNHIIAFAREHEGRWALTIAPRLLTSLVEEPAFPLGKQRWDDTFVVLPQGAPVIWEDAISGLAIEGEGTMFVGDVLAHFPGALLIGEKKP